MTDYKNAIEPVIASPVHLDAEIEAVRSVLGAQISWLEKPFGRARLHVVKGEGADDERVPKVYVGSRNYVSVMPNDTYTAYSFFRVVDSHNLIDEYNSNSNQYIWEVPVDLIVWFNLKRIDPAKDYIFTDELKAELLTVLNTIPQVKNITRIWDEKVEDIFSGYTLKQNQRDMMLYPYGGLRFECSLSYYQKCLV